MKIALIEPFVSKEEIALKAYADRSEPTHLLGMYNLLALKGAEVEIIDAYSNRISEWELTEKLVSEGFTHAGFTAYDYSPCLSYIEKVGQNLSRKVTLILGGCGATYTPTRMARIVRPDLIIRGDGEKALLELLLCDFNPQALPKGFTVRKVDGSVVVDSPPILLDDVLFDRPYSLDFYNYEASPRLQRGCPGKCVFCVGAYQNTIEYRSPKRALELLKYLVCENKAAVISPIGPDFTASPRKANEIVREMLAASFSVKEFRPGVRLDTLYTCIEREPELWRDLAARTRLHFESSIESFSYPRLKRLGKNVSKKFLQDIFHHMEGIIDVCDCTIVLGRIALDSLITIDEFILDSNSFINLLEAFPDRVTIGGELMNRFKPLWGTPSMAAGERDNPWFEENFFDDLAITELKRTLLDNPKFRKWCRLAEQIADFKDRNLVFREILRVAGEYAARLKTANPSGSP